MRNCLQGVLALAVGLSLASVAVAGDCTVCVTGKAERKEKPDVAYVTLYVRADGILMVDAVKKADQKIEELRKAIEEASSEIQTVEVFDVNLGSPRQQWNMDGKDEPPRPQIVRSLRITMAPNPTQIYEVIDKAIRAGALLDNPASNVTYSNEVRGVVVYGLRKYTQAEAEVRKAAMANAREMAETFATLAGRKVGKVKQIGTEFGTTTFVGWGQGEAREYPTPYVGLNSSEITLPCALSVGFQLTDE